MTDALPRHPLDPLDEGEVERAVGAVRDTHGAEGGLRFVSVQLLEPSKEAVEAFRPGDAVERLAELVVLDSASESAYEAVVALEDGEIRRWEVLNGLQPAIMPEEYEEVERLMKADPDFRAALARRGIDELDLVCVDPIPAGAWGDHPFEGRRLCRAAAWLRAYPDGNQYARPIEGVLGIVDLQRGEVLRVDDLGVVPLPDGAGEYRAALRGPMRDDLKPLEIHQPEGASFTVEGNLVRWQKWSFRVGFTAREGLVLHRVGYDDGGRTRSVLARASFCEMAVPYGDPTMGRHIHSPFDIGENLVGTLANSLELGCDCLGLIRYFDAVVCNSRGEAVRIANAVCLHEEDFGLLWKHYDFRTGHTEVRRSRRLVVSFIASIGNYDYGFYWHLYQDGTIEAEVKATGIVDTAAVEPGTTPRYGGLVAPGVNGMIHQHFFCARLDFDLDGRANTVHEVETRLADPAPTTPSATRSCPVRRTLRRESEAPALIDPLSARSWLVTNEERQERRRRARRVPARPGENVRAFAQPGSALERRAGFAFKHVWVTRYDPAERYAAGEYPNQNPGAGRAPRVDRAGPPDRERGRRALVLVRAPPRAASRGLAGHARAPHRLQAQAVRLLRREPRPRRAAARGRCAHCH